MADGKFEPKDNMPYVVEFTHHKVKEYPPPAENSDWGSSFLYFVKIEDPGIDDRYREGMTMSWFVKEYPHDMMQNAGVIKGSRFKIALVQDDSDKRKKNWKFEHIGGPVAQGAKSQQPQQSNQNTQQSQKQSPPPNQAPPPNDEPPHPADQGQYSQPNESPQSPPNANHFRALKQEVAATMDHAYKMAMVIQGIHADPMQDFSAEAFAACAHSLFIELRKSGWKPTSEEVEMTLEKIRQHVGKGEKQSAAK